MLELSLFPKNEEWGTGDEAIDRKLSMAFQKATANLSIESISVFYFSAYELKLRILNPGFFVTIELMVKALFSFLEPNEYVDHLIKKMKGDYYSKEKSIFDLQNLDLLIKELKLNKKFRYQDQIDFSLNLQDGLERNPYTRMELKRSSSDLNTKIIFKEFKNYLNNESKSEQYKDPFFNLLKGGEMVLVINGFGEFWFHQHQIFSLSLLG